MLLVLLRSSFVGRCSIALLLYDTRSLIERPTSHETFLTSRSLDIQNETISGKFLATSYPQDVTGFDIRPIDRNELRNLPRDSQELNRFVIDLIGNLSLPQFKSNIPDTHEANVDE
jgi:hypothetical protein